MALQKITTNIIEDNAVTGPKIALGSDAAGDIMYSNGTDYVRLPKGDDGDELVLESGLPAWGTPSGSPTDGNAWLFSGTHGGIQNANLVYYAFSSGSTQTVGTATTFGGTSISTYIWGLTVTNSATASYFNGGIVNGSTHANTCEKFTFASATDSANPTSLTNVGSGGGGWFTSSSTGTESSDHGVMAGGRGGGGWALPHGQNRRIAFASENITGDVGNLSTNKMGVKATSNGTTGLWIGGRYTDPNTGGGQATLSSIDQYTFASNTMAASPETLNGSCEGGSQSSSTTHGFVYGGYTQTQSPPLPHKIVIEKFAFASGNQQADHGDAAFGVSSDHGAQNTTHGFSIGGHNYSGANFTDINSYAFASNVTAAKVSDITFTTNSDAAASQVPTTN